MSCLLAHATAPKRIIELGALPGAIGAYIASRLNLEFVGVDYVNRPDVFAKTCSAFNVKQFRFECQDVFKMKFAEQFDIVASFGLVEHFKNPVPLFAIHRQLCAKGGHVIITVPNFRGLARCYHAIFNRETYLQHNLTVMSRRNMIRYAEQEGLRIIECHYVGNHRVWGMNLNLPLPLRFAGSLVQSLHNYLGRHLSLRGEFFSPWLICVAKAESADAHHLTDCGAQTKQVTLGL